MQLNPLMWTPPQIIAVYAIVGLLAVLLSIRLRGRAGRPLVEDKELNLVELAYLAGGPERVAETLLAGLLISKSVTWNANRSSIHIRVKDQAGVGSIALVQEFSRGNGMSQLEFGKKLRWLANRIQSELTQKGYFRKAPEARTIRPLLWLPFCAALILGMTKAPSGYFYVCVLITMALAGIWSIPSGRIISVRSVLGDYRARAGGVGRGSLDDGLIRAVALNGVKALSGTGYDIMFAEAKERGWTNIAYREGVAGEDGFVLH